MWQGGPGNAGHSLEEGCCEPEHNKMQNRAASNIGLERQVIIDPPNGRIPFQPWAAEVRRQHLMNLHTPTELQHIEPEDRCMVEGVPRINLRGPIAVTRAVLDGMIERRAGWIVSISSDAGRMGSSGEVVYSAAKAGVIGFSKALAREVARHGIHVNVVCPGPTNTPLLAEVGADNPKLVQALARAVPFGRIGEPFRSRSPASGRFDHTPSVTLRNTSPTLTGRVPFSTFRALACTRCSDRELSS